MLQPTGKEASPGTGTLRYKRHRPECTLLYQLINEYYPAFARTGAVTLIQRFGSALNLNIHFHILFLDGIYVDASNYSTRFQWVKAPTSEALTCLTHTLAQRIGRFLERPGLLVRDIENSYLCEDALDEDPMSSLLGHAITYRIVVGLELLCCDDPVEHGCHANWPYPRSAAAVFNPKRSSTRSIIVLLESTSCDRMVVVGSTSMIIPCPVSSDSWSSRHRTPAHSALNNIWLPKEPPLYLSSCFLCSGYSD